MTTRERRVLLVLAALYAAFVIPVGIYRGPDITVHMTLAEDVLHDRPLYDANPALGVWWPPFAIVAVMPLAVVAQLNLAFAKGIYALIGVICVFWSLARLRNHGWWVAGLALAAVAGPMQANFEYLNMHAILLALVVAAHSNLVRGRDAEAGAWIGLATALKLFPGLLIVYCALRGRWRAFAVAAVLSLGLTLLSVLAIDAVDPAATARHWWALNLAGWWLPHFGNQSLSALIERDGGSHVLALVLELALCCLAALALRDDDPATDVGLVTLLAVLLSPIAWSHAFLLAFPAWVAALAPSSEPRGRARAVVLVIAGIATSGILTVWWRPLKLALLQGSIYTWGGLLLLAVLLVERARWKRPEPATRA